MSVALPHPIRAHGGQAVVVALLLVVLVSPALRAGAQASPVGPVPVGAWPLQPRPPVLRAFDPPADPWGAGHRGVDLGGRAGDRVRSALAGRVTFAGVIAGRGVVVVDHGPTRTTYEPVAASVRVGDVVVRGQPLGTLEPAGSHCLPAVCLHWGWIRGDTYLDPLLLVGGGPVRLLPLWSGAPPVVPIPVVTQPFATVAAGLRAAGRPARQRASTVRSVRASSPGRRVVVHSFAMRPVLR